METIDLVFPSEGKDKNCRLHIGHGTLGALSTLINLEIYTSLVIVVDENLRDKPWFDAFYKHLKNDELREPYLIVLPPGESSKNIEILASLWRQFLNVGVDRKSLILSVGGGALCDLNGFAAATYMRGINFVHVPTTLLAQVDASIGGKVGINFDEIKNLVGVFAQPSTVLIDIDSLSTLPDRELNAGFAEVIKHGLIQDRKYYELVQSGYEKRRDRDFLTAVISGSCKIKAAVVKKDVKEGGLRKILNFGHTIGHAIESLSQKEPRPYLHGEAISIGMVAEAKLSEFLGFISHKEVLDIEDTLKDFDLPVRLGFPAAYEELMEKISADKKNTGSKVNWSLLAKIGKGNFDQPASKEQVQEAIKYISHV